MIHIHDYFPALLRPAPPGAAGKIWRQDRVCEICQFAFSPRFHVLGHFLHSHIGWRNERTWFRIHVLPTHRYELAVIVRHSTISMWPLDLLDASRHMRDSHMTSLRVGYQPTLVLIPLRRKAYYSWIQLGKCGIYSVEIEGETTVSIIRRAFSQSLLAWSSDDINATSISLLNPGLESGLWPFRENV